MHWVTRKCGNAKHNQTQLTAASQGSELNFLSLSCDVIHTAFVSEGLVQQLLLQTRCLGFRGHVSNMEMRSVESL